MDTGLARTPKMAGSPPAAQNKKPYNFISLTFYCTIFPEILHGALPVNPDISKPQLKETATNQRSVSPTAFAAVGYQ
jgi:hypothetical protein